MSSTAEELSSQAMQLQETIAFFKIDQGKKAGAVAVRNAGASRANHASGHLIKRVSEVPRIVNAATERPARSESVLIDLRDGEPHTDETDQDFERY
jgi:methyl-accepting chemotaxis protein